MDGEPGRMLGNAIYVIESEKLKVPTLATLKMLQLAKVVITDPNAKWEEIVKRLEFELTRDVNSNVFASNRRYEDVFASRFLVLQSLEHFERL